MNLPPTLQPLLPELLVGGTSFLEQKNLDNSLSEKGLQGHMPRARHRRAPAVRRRKRKPEPPPTLIQLTREQLLEGVDVGVQRDAMHPGPGNVILDRAFASIIGTVGEMGLALGTGYQWTGKFFPTMTALKDWMKTDGRDVEHLEIRTTPWTKGNLLLQPKNPPSNIYVLVRVPRMWQGEVRLVGWCYGFEGLRKSNWKDLGRGKKCFVVSGNKLHPMETLPKQAIAADNPKLIKFLQEWDPSKFVAQR